MIIQMKSVLFVVSCILLPFIVVFKGGIKRLGGSSVYEDMGEENGKEGFC